MVYSGVWFCADIYEPDQYRHYPGTCCLWWGLQQGWRPWREGHRVRAGWTNPAEGHAWCRALLPASPAEICRSVRWRADQNCCQVNGAFWAEAFQAWREDHRVYTEGQEQEEAGWPVTLSIYMGDFFRITCTGRRLCLCSHGCPWRCAGNDGCQPLLTQKRVGWPLEWVCLLGWKGGWDAEAAACPGGWGYWSL